MTIKIGGPDVLRSEYETMKTSWLAENEAVEQTKDQPEAKECEKCGCVCDEEGNCKCEKETEKETVKESNAIAPSTPPTPARVEKMSRTQLLAVLEVLQQAPDILLRSRAFFVEEELRGIIDSFINALDRGKFNKLYKAAYAIKDAMNGGGAEVEK